jgi:2-isopropylmalate synthase
MEEVAALLAYKSDELGLYSEVDLAGIYEVYQRLREIIRLEEPRNKAIFGKYAFGTAAGIHQAGMLRNPSTYEYVEPARFGRERTLLISRHSGRAVLRYLLADLELELDNNKLNEVYREYISERIESDCEDISVLRERLAADLVPASNGAAAGVRAGVGAS